jgi:GNAT superfamily N-acetyltransferase
LRYLTEIDYVDHMAWVALDPTQASQPGLGVARYVRLAGDPTAAEAAVTVLDEHQGRGIGTILLALLASSARQHGIERFRGYVLSENLPMVEILRDLGATVVHEGTLLQVDVPVPSSPEELPDTPTGRVFRSVAKRSLPPFRLRYPGTPSQEPGGPLA